MKKNYKILLKKYISLKKKDGYLKANKKVVFWILDYLNYIVYIIKKKLGIIELHQAVMQRRVLLSKQIDLLFNSTVKYGPFRGLKFSNKSNWGSDDRGSMILGLYEKEILESLNNISKKYSYFINLGAGDGYYGVGVLINNLFEKSICYEISEKGREIIKDNALLNNVATKIEIRGKAEKNFYNEINANVLKNAVLFIDIEGAEFEILDNKTFKAFSKSTIFVEIHEFFFEDGLEKLNKIKNESLSTHTITELTMKERDLSIFPELKKFHDSDRWLICSEGREQLMIWLRFDPNN